MMATLPYMPWWGWGLVSLYGILLIGLLAATLWVVARAWRQSVLCNKELEKCKKLRKELEDVS